jgi:thiol:disulfide interchange protein
MAEGTVVGEWVNNNSVWILGVALSGVAGWFAWQQRRSWRSLALIFFVVFVLSAGYWTSRQGPSDVATIAAVDAVLASGTPVVLEVYSDTCTICVISKRKVDGLEESLEGKAIVLRINIADEVGRAVTRRYGVGIVPTFIVFTPDGRERYRESGFPDTDRLEAEALTPG